MTTPSNPPGQPGANAAAQSRWQPAVKMLISAAVLAWLAYLVDWREFAATAASASVGLLVSAGALLIISNLLISWRWQLLLVPVGIHTSFVQALQSYLKGHFAAYFIPSGVTGDVVKALDLHDAHKHEHGRRGIELVSSIFIERGFGAMTVGMAVVLGLTLSPLVGQHAGIQQQMLLVSAVIIAGCLAALFMDKFIALIPRSLLLRLPSLGALLNRAGVSIVAYRRNPMLLAAVMLLSLVIQALRILPIYLIALSIGAGGEFIPYLIVVPIIFLANMIPVLGSRIGTEQGLFVVLLGLAGVSAESAMVIALASLVLGILTALPGGYWLIRGRAARPEAIAAR